MIPAPYRLRICAVLAVAAAVEVGTPRDTLGTSDSALGTHLAPCRPPAT